MPMKITCKCGQGFVAKDELGGKTVKCPKCGGHMKIPKPQAEKPAKQTAATENSCPSCGAGMARGAIVCIECGFNVELRRHIQTERGAPDGVSPEAPAARLPHGQPQPKRPDKWPATRRANSGLSAAIAVAAIVYGASCLLLNGSNLYLVIDFAKLSGFWSVYSFLRGAVLVVASLLMVVAGIGILRRAAGVAQMGIPASAIIVGIMVLDLVVPVFRFLSVSGSSRFAVSFYITGCLSVVRRAIFPALFFWYCRWRVREGLN